MICSGRAPLASPLPTSWSPTRYSSAQNSIDKGISLDAQGIHPVRFSKRLSPVSVELNSVRSMTLGLVRRLFPAPTSTELRRSGSGHACVRLLIICLALMASLDAQVDQPNSDVSGSSNSHSVSGIVV